MTTLDKMIAEIKDLTPIPAVAALLLDVAEKPDSSMEDIAEIIQYDPIMTVDILKTCNSAYMGLKQPAESIQDAVSMLGIDRIVELALVKSSAKVLTTAPQGYGLAHGDLWRYSIASAIIAKQAAVRLGLKNKSTIFTAALIKDIGKIILEKYVSKDFNKINALVKTQGYSFREAEKKILGIDHAELGALIAKTWQFSPRMIKLIRHHHLSDDSMMKDKEVAAVYLADCICMMMGIGVGADGLSYRFKDQLMKNHGITHSDITKLMAEFGVNMHEVKILLKMA
ncbi:HDOD domain-containing protein [uncultured Desulfobacter sp.]|uniref:HDOD domain-containing protein n=1 Tax=uncultured Desulfobacter sp. TaxID=240139 RepID=UPI002AABA2BD|nr:HDOD domain-containing protein [uncultured Desulfobacter sp.]